MAQFVDGYVQFSDGTYLSDDTEITAKRLVEIIQLIPRWFPAIGMAGFPMRGGFGGPGGGFGGPGGGFGGPGGGGGVGPAGQVGPQGIPGLPNQIQGQGINLPVQNILNFLGSGVSVVDNPGTGATDVTIPGSTLLYANTAWVDTVSGNDATGVVGDFAKPYATIPAALAAVASGQVVFLRPGIHTLSAGITIPDGVTLIGQDSNSTVIRMSGVSSATTVVTMGSGTRLQNLEVSLTTTDHVALTGVLFPGTSAIDAAIRYVLINVDNSGAAPAGSSDVQGVLVRSTGSHPRSFSNLNTCEVQVDSIGSGNKRALLVDTSAAQFSARDTNFRSSGTGAGTFIAVEVNVAGAILTVTSGLMNGSTADCSRTLGTLELGDVVLFNAEANGKGFIALSISSLLIWADPGSIPNGIRFMRPGTEPVTTTEIFIRMSRPAVVQNLSLRSVIAPGGATTCTVTVRKNGVDTALTAQLVGAATMVVSSGISVPFNLGDDISVKIDDTGATSDLVVSAEMF